MYYTVQEVAKLLRVKEGTVWSWVRKGQIPSIRLPGGRVRIPVSALKELGVPVK